MAQQGILLINTGSPDSPSVPDVRRYLREFLMDGRVLDIPLPARAAVVYGCVLPFRPRHSAAAYRQIWTEQGSPLVNTCTEVGRKLQAACGLPVELSMRYGNPSVENALALLARQAVQELVVFPMFPHYAMSSYESALVKVRETVHCRFPTMQLRIVPLYYNHSDYIDALAASALPYLTQHPDHLLFSFHGMPVRHLAKANLQRTCYRCQSRATVQALLKRLQWPEASASIAYQSRFGPDRWLEPHTDRELERLARAGVRVLAVICPSFTADCLETLEEIAERGRDLFLGAGGLEFRMIPALNSSAIWIEAMARIARDAMRLGREVSREAHDGPPAAAHHDSI